MASGFFLGGMAEGMNNAAQLGIKKDELAQDLALKTRGLDLQQQGLGLREKEMGQEYSLKTRALNLTEQAQKNAQSRAVLSQADKAVTDTMSVVSETIAAGLAAGKDPAIVAKAIQPLVESAKSIKAKSGGNPSVIDATVNALFARPTGTEAAAAVGTNKAAASVAEAKALKDAGIVKTDPEKTKYENVLRDDYTKAATDFIKIRDAKNRIDTIDPNGSAKGAGDIALLFQFMKILDPGSTVREGEFATAGSVAGVPGVVEAFRQKVIGGGLLSKDARLQIISQANALYTAQEKQFNRSKDQYRLIAKRQGLNPDNVIVDMSPNNSGNSPTGNAPPPPPPGFIINPGKR